MTFFFRLLSLLPIALFLLSGVAALIYQICWQRLLVIFVGGDIQSTTLIVTAFMLGLGTGYLVGGALADRQTVRRNLITFALLEIGICLWGYASGWIYYDFLWQYLGGVGSSRVVTGFLLIVLLLPPTFLMGMSLPVLARALTNSIAQAAGRISLLYGMNTVGAALGAFITAWCLLPTMGITGGLRVAAAINLACGLGVLPLLAFVRPPHSPLEESGEPATPSGGPPVSSVTRYLLLFGVTGFIALGLEIIWFRIFGVMIRSTAFTFGTLLGIYLAGLGLGSLIGSRTVHRSHNPLRTFLWMQAALALYAGTSMAALLHVIHHAPWCKEILRHLNGYDNVDVNWALTQLLDPSLGQTSMAGPPYLFPVLHVAVPLLLILPATLLMGLSFPYLQKAVQTDLRQLGRRTGWLQAANIAGSVAGTLIVGHLLLAWPGSVGTLKILAVAGGALGFIALRGQSRLALKATLWGALTLVPVGVLPSAHEFWAKVHGTNDPESIYVEDHTGLASIKKVPPAGWFPNTDIVFSNGLGQSWLPYDGIHSVLGILPSLLHPNPEHIAIIGLGSGDTAYSAAARKETKQVVSIEIVGTQLEALKRYHARRNYPPLQMLLHDPRFRHVNTDGRRYLNTTEQRFDIIEADALRPNTAGSGILYSREYFQQLKERLKPGGYAVTWTPTDRVRNAFLSVFPHVLDFEDMMVGSPDPIQVSTEEIRARLNQPEVQEHFRFNRRPVNELMAPYSGASLPARLIGPETERTGGQDMNSDLFPRDEFSLPVLWQRK